MRKKKGFRTFQRKPTLGSYLKIKTNPPSHTTIHKIKLVRSTAKVFLERVRGNLFLQKMVSPQRKILL